MSERLARMERMMARSIEVGGSDSASLLNQGIVRDATVMASTNPDVHPALGYTFENDLQTSWVYKRAKAHATRPFSIASSTQLTQSWSVLSSLSLSQISNIAVQALPIFESDLHNSNLYSFGGAEIEGLLATPTSNSRKHKRSVSESWASQIRSRLTQSGPKLTLTTQAGSAVETITLPKGLRLLGRNPTVSRRALRKTDISEPILLSSSAYEGTLLQIASKVQSLELIAPLNPGDIPSTEINSEIPQIPVTSDSSTAEPREINDVQKDDSSFELKTSGASASAQATSRIPRLKSDNGQKRTLPDLAKADFQLGELDFEKDFNDRQDRPDADRQSSPDSFYRNPFSSAMPMDDEIPGGSNSAVSNVTPDFKILYIAASLFEFNISRSVREAGYPYLLYQAGEVSAKTLPCM